MDYPHLRRLAFCPWCGRRKDDGLVICWPCHRELKDQHRGTWGKEAERYLDRFERTMANRGSA